MSPATAIQAFSLAEGGARPALSLYLDIAKDGCEILNRHTVIEPVTMGIPVEL